MSIHLSKREGDGTVRTFLAIDLPLSLKTELAQLKSDFAAHGSSLKWSAADLLHITVKFLGGVANDRIVDVESTARDAAARVGPFMLSLSGLGAFPNPRTPRVIWVGLVEDEGYRSMAELFAHLEDGLAARGFPRETRPFSPHITLARTRDTISAVDRRSVGDSLQRRQRGANVRGTWEVRDLVVMRSDLGREGPRYTPMATLPFGAGEVRR